MILYNVTLTIDKDIEAEWLEWMKSKHIPDIMNTGQFISSRISKLLDHPNENDEVTYVVQYECESRAKYDNYVNKYAAPLRDDLNKKYKEKFVAFRTLMEVID